ncbi:MAG: hypothetical protein QNJ46_23580 [Leptolyngbyaceae cyanobacterium MO_188.B28]|nr:hypothetical protein [Leptolyngbyaceae cyanobacterium MO_188.B28]
MSHYHQHQHPTTRYRSAYASPAYGERPDGRRVRRHPLPPVRRKRRSRGPAKFLVAGGSMVALAALLINPNKPQEIAPRIDICQKRVETSAVLSRAQLSQLLSVPERSAKESVRKIVEAPYCVLQPLELRAGIEAQREAYPLEFDPQTWFVVLYENEEYAGYDFSFRH